MKMPCNETRKLAPLAVGGDLEPGPLEALREHVEGCPACAALMDAAEAARAAYRGALPAPEPVDLWPALRRRLATEPRRSGAELAPRPNLRRLPQLVRVTASLAAAAALVFLARPWFTDGSSNRDSGLAPGANEVAEVLQFTGSKQATGPKASAFPREAFRGVSTRPAAEIPSGTLAARASESTGGRGLTRIEQPTMGEELRQQALQQNRSGLMFLPGTGWGAPQAGEVQAASNLSWPR